MNSQNLCLKCGMCCNGVIFADVKLQRGDNASRLRSVGLLIPHSGLCAPQFSQPCAALEGCRCRIYADRPKHCRQFDCLLLKSVNAGKIKPATALRKIKLARNLTRNIVRLLRQLGNTEETVALSIRFRHVTQEMTQGHFDTTSAHTYSKLTLAIHELNVLLSEDFYPGR